MIAETLSLAGEKLTLRPFNLDDAPRVTELVSNWNVASMVARILIPTPKARQKSGSRVTMNAALQATAGHLPLRQKSPDLWAQSVSA